jgi:hypothetical protein
MDSRQRLQKMAQKAREKEKRREGGREGAGGRRRGGEFSFVHTNSWKLSAVEEGFAKTNIGHSISLH